MQAKELKIYRGACHCRAVKFQVEAQPQPTVWICNCSICEMRKNHHFIIPSRQMKNLKGQQNLSTYTFGTHTAKHKFCKVCGITPFYIPRSNPDGYAITLDCLDREDRPKNVKFQHYDGQNWEKSYSATGIESESK